MTILGRSKVEIALYVLAHGGFPWAGPAAKGATPLERQFRRRARHLIMRRWPPLLRPVAAALMAFAWPFSALRDSYEMARDAPPGSSPGWSRTRLFLGAFGYALRHNVRPLEFIVFRLFEPRGISVDAWLLGDEGTRVVVEFAEPDAIELANDKHAFAAFSAGLELPAAQSLALCAHGEFVVPFAGGLPPLTDLVIKPRRGAKAVGVEPWYYRGGAFHAKPEGAPMGGRRALSGAELDQNIRATSRRHGEVIVQPMLRRHPILAPLAGDGVITARVITGSWPDGRVEVIDAMVQRPADGAFLSPGPRFALIDPATGRVRDDVPGQQHPDRLSATMDPHFIGLTVPDWGAACADLLRMHAAFPARVAILGSDVAFTPDGPVILETNIAVSFYLFQMASLRPALKGPLGPLMEAWLAWRG